MNKINNHGNYSDYLDQRAIEEASYIIDNLATIRDAAKKFGVCKSLIHRDITKRLPKINQTLANDVRIVLDLNLDERHIRGGRATHIKFKGDV